MSKKKDVEAMTEAIPSEEPLPTVESVTRATIENVLIQSIPGKAFPNKHANQWLVDHYEVWGSLCAGDRVYVPEDVCVFLGDSVERCD